MIYTRGTVLLYPASRAEKDTALFYVSARITKGHTAVVLIQPHKLAPGFVASAISTQFSSHTSEKNLIDETKECVDDDG